MAAAAKRRSSATRSSGARLKSRYGIGETPSRFSDSARAAA
jgi:hypothetical protein